MIYFDNSATTRPFDEVVAAVSDASQTLWFNASATYRAGIDSFHALERARKIVADALGVLSAEVYFTSGGTEADNIALLGAVRKKRGRIVAGGTEHPAVHNCLTELAARGMDVQFVRTLPSGQLDEAHFAELVTPDTCLVTVMHVNNETGVVNDIAALSRTAKRLAPECVFHSDGVQAFGKTPADLSAVDLYALSGHKIHGGKGVGALYCKKSLHLTSPVYGGGQERGVRSGTENVPGILGLGVAVELYADRREEILAVAAAIRARLIERFLGAGLDVRVNGEGRVQPNVLSVSFRGVKAEVLYQLLSDRGIYVSRGSACSTRVKTTRIAQALRLPKEYAEGTMRFSTGFGNTLAEADEVADAVVELVRAYRR